ncbi:VWA domain-containing protein [Nocardia abscessus]|uniref:VWA domain-containing protein n=1 Tax=Nocardia abscessus TaxID=120957 RepID=UPI002457597D|nr:VWA domain-containing protein [Nocardia abscessus]
MVHPGDRAERRGDLGGGDLASGHGLTGRTFGGRRVDNTGLFAVDDIEHVPDPEFSERSLSEFPSWTPRRRQAGIRGESVRADRLDAGAVSSSVAIPPRLAGIAPGKRRRRSLRSTGEVGFLLAP